MRIVAGRFRGRRLAAVGKGDADAHLRPTGDRARESLFSMLDHLGAVRDARVLDLFSGTGALGLEALSRGASHVTFIDNGRTAGRLITKNIRTLDIAAETRLIRKDAARPGVADGPPHDLVFLDPPYGKSLGDKALVAAQHGGWIAPGAMVAWEERAPMSAPSGFHVLDTRVLGGAHFTLLQANAAPEP